jgi:hypothetical protein
MPYYYANRLYCVNAYVGILEVHKWWVDIPGNFLVAALQYTWMVGFPALYMLLAGPIFMLGFVPLMRGMSEIVAPLPRWGIMTCAGVFLLIEAALPHYTDLPFNWVGLFWLRRLIQVGIVVVVPPCLTLALAVGLQHYLERMSSRIMQPVTHTDEPPLVRVEMNGIEHTTPPAGNTAPSEPLLADIPLGQTFQSHEDRQFQSTV